MTATHTPTPYFLDRLNGPTENSRPMLCVVTRDVTIAELDVDGGPDQATRDANAAFIVRACNAHDALVAAAMNLLSYMPESDDEFQNKLEAALVTALKLAKGEA